MIWRMLIMEFGGKRWMEIWLINSISSRCGYSCVTHRKIIYDHSLWLKSIIIRRNTVLLTKKSSFEPQPIKPESYFCTLHQLMRPQLITTAPFEDSVGGCRFHRRTFVWCDWNCNARSSLRIFPADAQFSIHFVERSPGTPGWGTSERLHPPPPPSFSTRMLAIRGS